MFGGRFSVAFHKEPDVHPSGGAYGACNSKLLQDTAKQIARDASDKPHRSQPLKTITLMYAQLSSKQASLVDSSFGSPIVPFLPAIVG